MTTTMNDYRILQAILDDNDATKGVVQINGTTRAEIQEKTGKSLSKIAQSLNVFIEQGLVEEGVREGRTKKYVLTSDGIDKVEELVKMLTELQEASENTN